MNPYGKWKRNMFIDLHVHTRQYSGCSYINPEELIERACLAGLQGLVLTEHGILWPADKLDGLRQGAASRGLLILAGQEITCLDRGRRQDFLVLGMNRSLGTASSAQALIEMVHHEGGLVIAAHPYKPSRLGTGYHGAGDDIYELDVDALELFHPNHNQVAREKVLAAAESKGLPMTGGSDAHDIYEVGLYCTRFPDHVSNMDQLMEAIRSGQVSPENGSRTFKATQPGAPAPGD
jgi:hypothetical protein